MSANAAESTNDRELFVSRVFEASRELVFRMWTEGEHLAKWFGPKGFSCTMHEVDVRVGGRWRFDMNAPDGTVYSNRIEYLEIVPNERLVFHHGADKDNDPNRFLVTVTFHEQANKKTVVLIRQLFVSKADRDVKIGFGAVELGHQTYDRLVEHLRTLR